MDKKLLDIQNEIQASSNDFYDYLTELLPTKVLELVDILLPQTEVYLFSGIIRDYFIKSENTFRDIDFIVSIENIDDIISNYNYTKNSFGGYKIMIDAVTVDIWSIKNTWGILNKSYIPFPELLPNTTFFNASSILYSLKNKQFIIGRPFLNFLRNKKLDIVLEKNPTPALCIINSLYYSQKYSLKISKELSRYILNNYDIYVNELENVQRKHFKEILYNTNDILAYKQSLSQN